MRRLRAGLCLAVSLLTAGLPTWAGEVVSPVTEAPLVRLESPRLEVPTSLQAAVLPGAQAPLSSLELPQAIAVLPAALPVAAAVIQAAAPIQAAKASAYPGISSASGARAQPATALAHAEAITATAASAEKAGASAERSELERAWTGSRASAKDVSVAAPVRSSWIPRFLTKAVAVAGAALAPAIAHAAPAAAAAASAPAKAAVPVGVARFMAAYGKWVAGGAILAGTFAAMQAVTFVVDRIAKMAKWEPTTTVAVRLAARIGTVTVGVLVGMHAAGVPTTALVTTFGIGGVGVTMAVKDFIGNTIEGAKVLVNQPFVIGDRIQIGDNKYTVADMDLYYAKLKRDGLEDSVTFKPYGELAGTSIKVFRPYSTAHKTRLFERVSLGGALKRALSAPGLMWRATKEMPRPSLKRSTLWLGAGLALLLGIPKLESLVMTLLPRHFVSVAPALGWATAGLVALGFGYFAYRLAKSIKTLIDGWAEKHGWNKWVKGVVGAAAFAAVVAGGAAGIYFGLPLAKSIVAVGLVGNMGSVAGFLHTAFSWLQAAAILAATRSAQSWLAGFLDHLAGRFKWNTQLVLAMKLGVEVLSYVVGGSLALRQVGMTWGSLMTTLGATSAALGWAASDVLGNLIHGVWLLWRKPFRVNDWLSVDGYVGQVVDITVQYVVLSQEDGSHVLVPQGVMKKGFTPLKTPEDVARAKAERQAVVDQADFLADLYKKSKAK